MARTLDPAVYAVRRDTFVDAAQHLIAAKGYEQMSISDVLAATEASRGAFYHYFDSKAALLEAVVERMVDGAIASIDPMVTDPTQSAAAKFRGFFVGIARFKGDRTELLLGLLDTWLSDENAIVREKFRRRLVDRLTPVMTAIISQGQAEGVFTTADAPANARVVVSLIQGANDAAVDLFLGRRAGTISYEHVERTLDAYWRAFERVLGAEPGSLVVVDPALIRQWYG